MAFRMLHGTAVRAEAGAGREGKDASRTQGFMSRSTQAGKYAEYFSMRSAVPVSAQARLPRMVQAAELGAASGVLTRLS